MKKRTTYCAQFPFARWMQFRIARNRTEVSFAREDVEHLNGVSHLNWDMSKGGVL
jgi:hypothetical protein